MRKWLAPSTVGSPELPWNGKLKPGWVPGVGEAVIDILEADAEWNSIWKLFGQFLLCMHQGESTLEGCDHFKQNLAALCKQDAENGHVGTWLDTVTAGLAEKLLSENGISFPFYVDPKIIETSNLSEDQKKAFLALDILDSVGAITGVGPDLGLPNLNGAGIFTIAQLLGTALIQAVPNADVERMDISSSEESFWHRCIKDNVSGAWRKKVLHQVGERLCRPILIEYHVKKCTAVVVHGNVAC